MRARVDRFYSLIQEGHISQAMNLVTEDTRDNFLGWPKGDFTSAKILDLKPSEPASHERADVTVDLQVPGPTGTPIHMKSMTSWKLVDGVWFLVAAKAQPPNFQKIFMQTAAPSQPPELQFEKEEFLFGEVASGGTTTATFEFKNIADHPVQLDITTYCDCLVVKDLKKQYEPGETGKFKVDFHAQVYPIKISYSQTLLVKTRPGLGGQSLLIKGYITGAPKATSPKP